MPEHPDSLLTSLSLLERARNREPFAWEHLVRLYTELVYKWCRQWGLRQDAAEVVGQEVFISVFRSLGSFRKEKPGDTFRGWLRRITARKRADYIEWIKNQPVAVGGDDAHSFLQEIPDHSISDDSDAPTETQYLYLRAVELIQGACNATDFMAFMQVTAHERKAKDVAAELGISENSVFLAKSRILKRAKEHFGELLPELDDPGSSPNGSLA